jgi:UDP-N-acetylmuramoyl-L-alanyl-D-glutamate--2,6-diaminopimelate ligase
VDYAHTAEGIKQAIDTARHIAVGNVIAVFGAGGDRDRSKRLPMGEAASAADLVVVTSDNPRSEDPESIVSQIAAGVTAPLLREVDRRRAIFEALELAGPDDLVLILGKGHEQGQEVGPTVFPFDDRTIAGEALIRLRKSANSGPDSGSIRP